MAGSSDGDAATGAQLLDTRGLLCPLPVIRTQNRVKDLPAGTLLDIVASDPGVLHDIPAWCRIHGHEVVASEQQQREIRIRVRVGGFTSIAS